MKRTAGLAVFVVLAIGSVFFSAIIQADPIVISQAAEGDPLFRLLGTAKEAMGDLVILRADAYLHSGLREDIARTCDDDESGKESHKDHKAGDHAIDGDGWAEWVYNRMGVTELSHLEGQKARELVPILDVSTKLNPHNLLAVLTAAYWYRSHVGDSRAALEVLARGIQENPASWEVEFEAGQILSEDAKEYEKAVPHYLEAIKKMPMGEHMIFDPVRARYGLAQCYERLGRAGEAVIFYREALALYPAGQTTALKGILEKKIKETHV